MTQWLLTMRDLKQRLLAGVVALSLASCGAGVVVSGISGTGINVAGISGTGIVFGVITGFGSVFVNGVEYEIDHNTAFDVNGNTTASQQDLAIGMAVKLKVKKDSNGVETATAVFYDEAIKGSISSTPQVDANNAQIKRFTVLSDTVVVNDVSTSFKGVTFQTLAIHDVLEISGLRDANGDIIATRVEKKGTFTAGSTEVEIHGIVANLSSTAFNLGTTSVSYSNSVEYDDMRAADLQDGLLVEVKGILQADGSVVAQKIQSEAKQDEDIKTDGNELNLQGYVTQMLGSDGFVLNGITVKVDTQNISAALFAQVSVGTEVEIKGVYQNNELLATELELRAANATIEGNIFAINTALNTLKVGVSNTSVITVEIDNTSKLEDDSASSIEHLTLLNLAIGNPVKVKFIHSATRNTVTVLKRENALDEFEIEGTLDAFDATAKTLTLFGAVFKIDPNANAGDVADFFTKVKIGDKVELKDTDKNGLIDELSVSD